MTDVEKSDLYKRIVAAQEKVLSARTRGPLWMLYEGVMYVRDSDQDEWREKTDE